MRKTNEAETERGRWSSKKKMAAVLRLLKGEDLETLSRELRVNAATLSSWRDVFLASGLAGLKNRGIHARDEKIPQLQKALGETALNLEIPREIVRGIREEVRPFSVGKIDEVRRAAAISQNRLVQLKRVCTEAGVARSSVNSLISGPEGPQERSKRRRTARAHPSGAYRLGGPRRGVSQGAGEAALPGHPHQSCPRAALDARSWTASSEPQRRPTWIALSRRDDHPDGARHALGRLIPRVRLAPIADSTAAVEEPSMAEFMTLTRSRSACAAARRQVRYRSVCTS